MYYEANNSNSIQYFDDSCTRCSVLMCVSVYTSSLQVSAIHSLIYKDRFSGEGRWYIFRCVLLASSKTKSPSMRRLSLTLKSEKVYMTFSVILLFTYFIFFSSNSIIHNYTFPFQFFYLYYFFISFN